MNIRPFFIDWEFIEDGHSITPLSVGITSLDPKVPGLYLVNGEAQGEYYRASPWVAANVIPHLGATPENTADTEENLTGSILRYLGYSPAAPSGAGPDVQPTWGELYAPPHKIQLWTWYGAYDHVTLAQRFGPMADHPRGLPMYAMDLKMLTELYPAVQLPPKPETEHHALADAEWIRDAYLSAEHQIRNQKLTPQLITEV